MSNSSDSPSNQNSLQVLCRTMRLTSKRRFELIVVRCNYENLQRRLLNELHHTCSVSFEELELKKTNQTLYTLIETEYKSDLPDALCVSGFEYVKDLDTLLLATNQVREEFRKNFNFPLVLWLNDQILQKFIRLVPDFYSWATPLSFDLSNQELLALIKGNAELLFEHTLNASDRYPASDTVLSLAIKAPRLKELRVAQNELKRRNQPLEPEFLASVQLALGRENYRHDALDEAEENYQNSLKYWDETEQAERSGMVLFHLGLCYRRRAYVDRSNAPKHWLQAKECFSRCLKVLEAANCHKLVANFIGQLGDALQQIEEWNELKKLAEKSLKLHRRFPNRARMARDCGFLAAIALKDADWENTRKHAQNALNALEQAPSNNRQRQGLYLLLLAQAQYNSGEIKAAIVSLEKAKFVSKPLDEPSRYIQILETLRDLYFKQEAYLKAFDIKQEQRAVESQYGYRAFIGASRLRPLRSLKPTVLLDKVSEEIAQEIAVSVRYKDINRLVERITRPNHKLTIIHGQSGVGKSSMMSAGLVPTLKSKIINSRDVLPVYCQFYGNWVEHLGESLEASLERYPDTLIHKPLDTVDTILSQIRQNDARNLLTVLIFDQFEEFFIACDTSEKWQPFFNFLDQCFQNIPYIKVFIVLREDYLHYLLEYERLPHESYIGNNILSIENRFELGNFSKDDAKAIVNSLTERSNIMLEPELVNEVVKDLAREGGKVRPIELQIVGAQLQAENIETLEEYQKKGPKNKLVQQYLEEVVKDCGPENKKAAELILYLLTGDNDTRPQRTRIEIEKDLKRLANDLIEQSSRLDLVLNIFVKSGLVFLWPETPSNRYQLVHDYLATFIRRQQQPEINEIITRLEREKIELKQAIKALEKEREQREKTEEELEIAARNNKRARQAVIIGTSVLSSILAIAIALGLRANLNLQKFHVDLEYSRRSLELEREGWRTLQKFESESEPLQSLIAAIEVGLDLKRFNEQQSNLSISSDSYNPASPIFGLQQILSKIRLKNRLSAHKDGILSVMFNPQDSRYLLTGSRDKTAYLWDLENNTSIVLKGHVAAVLDVNFKPNSDVIATASEDGTVRFWDLKGNSLSTCQVSSGPVFSIVFSPQGDFFVTASLQEGIQVWEPSCNLLRDASVYSDATIISLSLSPDGKTLAAASSDSNVRIWEMQNKKLMSPKILIGHEKEVRDVAFSPDGQTIATVSIDGTGRLWNLQGKELVKFAANYAPMRSITFLPDVGNVNTSSSLVTTSDDSTVRLWNLRGQELLKLEGHQATVWDASVNPDMPNVLATVSDDKTVGIWTLENKLLESYSNPSEDSFLSLGILNSSISYNERFLAAISEKGIVYIWNHSGKPLYNFKAHSGQSNDIQFHPNQLIFLTASNDGLVKIWDLESSFDAQSSTWIPVEELSLSSEDNGESSQPSSAASFSSSGDKIAIALQKGFVSIWNTETDKVETIKLNQGHISALEFSQDESYLVTTSLDGRICIWYFDDTAGSSQCITTKSSTPILSATMNLDNQILVTADTEGAFFIWEKEQIMNTERKGSKASTRAINDLAISQNGDLLATASADGIAKLWTLNGNQLAEYQGHKTSIQSIHFISGDNKLLTISRDGKVQPWDIDNLDRLLSKGCTWLSDYIHFTPIHNNSAIDSYSSVINFCLKME
ncbi:hypothetical protein IQ260_21975 [Leptolyngbya cf. ectocarpi LEGE 11479]|uniref:Novel STAND NTPase 1 domain-containing protein n=1 Tax=Leptolyngbya cf. ectocarpi LEGE 11479 TaxID=1828722 RepID=A0A928ZXP1_LEPEC|nr:WD40 repeat domain-containing protein [Leptolyngbya ectocarpi]MBE9069315.1 hypothetical protein [Leptolyngbya cf. ectocarpi LEGE 11479]